MLQHGTTSENEYMTCNLQSSSTISTVELPASGETMHSSGTEDGSIVRIKSSVPSSVSSLFIGIPNLAVVFPTENVTVYGPEL